MKKYNNYLSVFLFLLLCTISGYIQGQTKTVAHKIGAYYGTEGYMTTEYGKSMQRAHTYRTIVYVNPNPGTKTITLPSTSTTSPHSYYRWYNYKTDGNSAQIQSGDSLFTNGRGRYDGKTFDAVTYTVPSTLGTTSDIIACDVSANTDYSLSGTTLTEPTLSYRCVFEIRSAKEIADKLKTCTGNTYLEEYTVYMPSTKLSGAKNNPRVCLKYNADNYFGYNQSNTLVQGSSSNFNLKNASQALYSNRFCLVAPGAAGTTKIVTATMNCGNNTYNVARFTIIFLPDAPMIYDNLTGINEYRSTTYMDKNNLLLSKLDFDYNTDPATVANNMWPKPLSWDICTYGFASKTLFESGKRGFSNRVSQWNEYGFYKTANVALSGISGYTWYNNYINNDSKNGRAAVYDRKHHETNGSKDGYFMYIDAAESPGIVAKLALDKLCPGTKLFVSAGICSLTSSGSASDPDLNFVFIGVDENGKETELNRFTSGDIPSTATTSPTPWYQMFYSFTFNSNVEYTSYLLQVENNCLSTSGGDYAVDDIRIYRSKPSVQANQITLPCGNENAKVKIKVEYEKLLSTLGKTEVTSGTGEKFNVNYKFLDSSKNSLSYNYNTTTTPDLNFGTVKVSTKFSEMTAMTSTSEAPYTYSKDPSLAYTETETVNGTTYRYIVFQTPNNNVLKENYTYYTAVANSSGIFGTGTCDMISEPFVIIPPSEITVDGAVWKEGDGMCYGNDLVLGAKLRDRITHEEIVCNFDWYMGTKEEFATIPTGSMSVSSALAKYREVYPNPVASDAGLSAASGVFTQEAYNILQSLIAKNKLILNKTEITRLIRAEEYIIAVPISKTAKTTATTTTLELCDEYITIDVGSIHKNPTIQLSGEGTEKTLSVRMGLSQFNDLKNNSTKTLTIPVVNFWNTDMTKNRTLIKASDTKVYLIMTDDSSIQNVDSLNPSIQVANLETIYITPSTSDTDYLIFKIPSGAINVKEGYTYKMEFHFNQELLIGDAAACDGVTSLYLKIVPEYLTWTGTSGDNWNNDNNWKRSLKSELYKGTADSYTDDLNSKGFVPMNFSKATIQNSAKAPWLYNLTGTPYLNMNITNYSDGSNAATSSIEYSLMVKANGTNYDCSNFYGNTCSQIYFKPSAEMRNTNYLTYNKAWVDFELTSGRWYMLTSPLKSVVAGDMYLPTASGRQETEAFMPITFSTTTYNRFSPAVYQRSWDHSSSTVFNTNGTSYDSYISANWSQVYNKVDEAYSQGKGFSIRPVFGTEETGKVLFRLPKDDTSFSYYSYDGNTSGNNTAISRSNNGRLIFENNASSVSTTLTNTTSNNNIFLLGNPFMATLDMKRFFDAHTDFERRFWVLTTNGQSAVAIANDGTLTTSGDETLTGTVAPMQSFFVEKKSSVTGNPTVTFTPDMTITKPVSGTLLRSVNTNKVITDNNECLRITAKRNGSSSSIIIKRKENASNSYDSEEDVPLLIDSNLTDAPTLYTMAGNQAAMINVLSDQTTIPLGIYSEDANDVTLTFKGIEDFGGYMELYDAVINKTTQLDGTSNQVTVSGNTHNRYFLNISPTGISKEEGKFAVYSPERGKIVVATTSSDKLQSIRVYTLSGSLLKVINDVNNIKTEFSLANGIYVLRIQSMEHFETKKVICQ
jgi:hypothetical protein